MFRIISFLRTLLSREEHEYGFQETESKGEYQAFKVFSEEPESPYRIWVYGSDENNVRLVG